MTPIESAEQLIALIRESDAARSTGGCDPDTLATVESALGLELPPSYRRALAELGSWDCPHR